MNHQFNEDWDGTVSFTGMREEFTSSFPMFIRPLMDAAVARTVQDLEDRLGALPGVENATAASALPRTFFTPSASFTVEGRGTAPEDAEGVSWVAVGEGYLETLGMPLLRGRNVDRQDHQDSAPVVLINRAMAEKFWPGEDPLGAGIQLLDQRREVVGIVSDIQQNLFFNAQSSSLPLVYLPAAQSPPRGPAFLLRTGPKPETLAPAVRELLSDVDPDLQALGLQSFESLIDTFFGGIRAINQLLIAVGLVALVLAAVGIYGVIAYSVAQRTREIGIRMALGARRRDVLRQVTWEGLVLALLGFFLGGIGVVLVVLGLTAMLRDLTTISPMVTVAVAGVLFLVAVAASVLPARRAAGIDPLIALRAE